MLKKQHQRLTARQDADISAFHELAPCSWRKCRFSPFDAGRFGADHCLPVLDVGLPVEWPRFRRHTAPDLDAGVCNHGSERAGGAPWPASCRPHPASCGRRARPWRLVPATSGGGGFHGGPGRPDGNTASDAGAERGVRNADFALRGARVLPCSVVIPDSEFLGDWLGGPFIAVPRGSDSPPAHHPAVSKRGRFSVRRSFAGTARVYRSPRQRAAFGFQRCRYAARRMLVATRFDPAGCGLEMACANDPHGAQPRIGARRAQRSLVFRFRPAGRLLLLVQPHGLGWIAVHARKRRWRRTIASSSRTRIQSPTRNAS